LKRLFFALYLAVDQTYIKFFSPTEDEPAFKDGTNGKLEKAAVIFCHACHAGLIISLTVCTFDKHDLLYFHFIVTPGH
jgi:hypothetical protein